MFRLDALQLTVERLQIRVQRDSLGKPFAGSQSSPRMRTMTALDQIVTYFRIASN